MRIDGKQVCGTLWVTGEQVVTGGLLVNGTTKQYKRLKAMVMEAKQLVDCTSEEIFELLK